MCPARNSSPANPGRRCTVMVSTQAGKSRKGVRAFGLELRYENADSRPSPATLGCPKLIRLTHRADSGSRSSRDALVLKLSSAYRPGDGGFAMGST